MHIPDRLRFISRYKEHKDPGDEDQLDLEDDAPADITRGCVPVGMAVEKSPSGGRQLRGSTDAELGSVGFVGTSNEDK